MHATPDESSTSDSWMVENPSPTSFIALWPDQVAPTEVEINAALGEWLDGNVELLQHLDATDETVRWNAVVRLGDRPTPVIIWLEQFAPTPEDVLPKEAQAGVKWVVGVETILDTEDPITDYTWLMRTIVNVIDGTPAVLDLNSTRVFTRNVLEHFFDREGVDPPAELLWVVHAVASEDGDDAPCWVHTHGLQRCGRPDFEIIELPRKWLHPGAELLSAVAEKSLSEALPPPGTPFFAGNNIEIALAPWEEVVEYIDDAPGGKRDRYDDGHQEDEVHTGVRAVLCGPDPEGSFRRVWRWPHVAISNLAEGDATLYRTTRETARVSRIARATWPELAMSFATIRRTLQVPSGQSGVDFIVKAGYEIDPEDASSDDDAQVSAREHLWFEIQSIGGDRASAILLNQPFYIRELQEGDQIELERDRISDWRVVMPHSAYGPDQVIDLKQALEAMREHDSID